MTRAVLVALLVVAMCVALGHTQAVLRAINGASKTLEWTSTGGGDLTFSHNTKNYLTFLTANSNDADFPQGALLGAAQAQVPGAIQLVTNADGTTDIQGFVRGRWLSLSQDDPKNLFVNGFEISSVSSAGVLDNLATNDRSSPAIAVQIVAGDSTQNFAVVSLQDTLGGIPNGHQAYWYKCNLLDCSGITSPVTQLAAGNLVSGIPSFTVNSVGVTYALALGSGGGLNLVSASITAASIPGTNFFTTLGLAVPAISPVVGNVPIALPNVNGGSGSSLINPVSIQILNPDTLHAVYYQPAATAYYGDSTTLYQCNGQLTIAAPTTVTLVSYTAQEQVQANALPAQFAALFGGNANFVVGPSYVIFGTAATAPLGRTSANVLTPANAVSIWTPQNPNPALLPTPPANTINPASGTITYGTSTLASTGETVFVVQWLNMQYSDGTPAFSGQVQLSSAGAVFIEVTSSQPPTSAGANTQQITQGETLFGNNRRLNNGNNPPSPTTPPNSPYCYNSFARSLVYLTCPTNTFANPCLQLPFGWGYVPVTRHINGPFTTGLHSLDSDPTNALRFVYSGLFTNVLSTAALANEQLAIFQFTGAAAGGFYRPASPVLIDMGTSEFVAASLRTPAVDFDAEISAAGTWMAIVGLRSSSLEPFPWSYRVLSFTTFPATSTYVITSAAILVTSIDLDTNGESTPFGAAKLTKRGSVNYATILIGEMNLAATLDGATAGVPVIFRSVDDAFTQTYVAFPNPYHAITSGAVTLWPHVVSDDVSVVSVPAWRQGFNNAPTWSDYPTVTRYTNGFLSPNAQLCNSTVAGKFYTLSSRTYACAEVITQNAIWTPRSGVYTWAPVGTYGMRRHFARPNDRNSCQ